MTWPGSPATVQACVNGVRTAQEHAAIPVTPEEIAKAAEAAIAAGADTVHLHVKDEDGVDTLDPGRLADLLHAVRAACPGLEIGVSTGAWMRDDARARRREVERWQVLPDFASVNWHEAGSPELADQLLERGVGIEAGLWYPDAVEQWAGHPTREQHRRVLVELPDGLEDQAVRVAADEMVAMVREVSEIAILLHGEGSSAWPALAHAVRHGLDTRIGLEDSLVLPDGQPALGNEDLLRAAARIAAEVVAAAR